MNRTLLTSLITWANAPDRKPLVVRGARQVGKTWLIRQLAQVSGKQLLELNFEKNAELLSYFNSNDPQQILLNLSTLHNQPIEPQQCLLFLDEIQAAPQLLSKLRWFAEDMPQLAVVAAGSLLEFVLADHSFSMPVGRISYLHVEPLSFEEFLLASEKTSLLNYLTSYQLTHEIPIAIHQQLTQLFKEYILIGGMPAAVANWTTERSLNRINQIHHDLLSTYRDDFVKFKGRLALERLNEVMLAVPKMLGQKFVYSRVNSTVKSDAIKQALNLLSQARICHAVTSCAANGIPLGAEANEKYCKQIFLDTGLCNVALGLNFQQINSIDEIILINNGGVAEQVAGQLLRTLFPAYVEPTLFYWLRDEKGASAEVDYIIQHGSHVIPVEIKAGSTGGLKSLHLFMELKKLALAVRVNSDLPSKMMVEVKGRGGNVKYELISLPFYLIGQLQRLLDEC